MAREEEEKPKAFKVEDRRRFSAEGELKPEQRTEARSAPEPSSEAAPNPDAAPRITDSEPNFTASGIQGGHDQGAGELTFATFLVGLSTQALVHLGEIPEPHSGKLQGDLLAAEQVIDIIAMLQNKTRGNLEADEAQLIGTILFELRMKYVERARQASH